MTIPDIPNTMPATQESWLPELMSSEERAQLEAIAMHAEHLSDADLRKLASGLQTLHELDQQKAEAAGEQKRYE